MIEKLRQRFSKNLEFDGVENLAQSSKMTRYTNLLLFIFVFLVLSVLISRTVNQAPTIDISVDSENLDVIQLTELKKVIDQQPKRSFFNTDLPSVYKQINQLSWVEKADIDRHWIQGIKVAVSPRQPIARFGSNRLLDVQGVAYTPAGGELSEDNKKLVTLQGNPEQAKIIMKQMHQVNEWFAPLKMSVDDMVLTPRMTWIIKFNTGLRLLVDGENTEQKLWNVSRVLQSQLANKRKNIRSIDLRYKNGFAIAWKYQ